MPRVVLLVLLRLLSMGLLVVYLIPLLSGILRAISLALVRRPVLVARMLLIRTALGRISALLSLIRELGIPFPLGLDIRELLRVLLLVVRTAEALVLL